MNVVKKKVYDVCVVGSGAAGGFMAKELAEAGADTLLLEAGRKVALTELPTHTWPYELPRQGRGVDRQAALYPDDIRNAIEYHSRDGIHVDRIRTLGGRTVHWNAVCLRFSEDDFRERSVNGLEEDWPLSYQELAPFILMSNRLWVSAAPAKDCAWCRTAASSPGRPTYAARK